MSAFLTAENLRRSFATGRGGLFRPAPRFFAVDGVSLELEKGQTLGIVGESGCGKSTLSKLILGLIEADGGSVRLGGQETLNLADADWRAMRRRMQLVYQDAAGALDPRMTVRAQVEEPLRIHGLPLGAAEEALRAVGLNGAMAGRYPHEMSGGQLQRVVIARALAQDTALVLADEPIASLDPAHQISTMQTFATLAQEGRSVLVSMHDLGLAARHCTRLILLGEGRLIADGLPGEVLTAERLARVFGITAWFSQTDDGPVFQPLEVIR